jgi:hypothetical protein
MTIPPIGNTPPSYGAGENVAPNMQAINDLNGIVKLFDEHASGKISDKDFTAQLSRLVSDLKNVEHNFPKGVQTAINNLCNRFNGLPPSQIDPAFMGEIIGSAKTLETILGSL